MPPETSTSGYDLIANQPINMGPNAFGNASFGPLTNDDQSPHFFRTVHNKNISYVWNRDCTEFSTIIVGQIMPPSFSTIHSVKGNHYGVNGDVSKT